MNTSDLPGSGPLSNDSDPDAPRSVESGDRQKSAPVNAETTRSERLDLYKLAVEMADRVSSRRTHANNFFLALNAAFASTVTFLGLQTATAPTNLALLVIAAGLFLCLSWFLILRSYRDLNAAKFKVINAIEVDLPVQLFTEEWRFLKADPVVGWRGRYREQGTVERIVPILFAVLYLAAGWGVMTR